jgi:arsenate reductase
MKPVVYAYSGCGTCKNALKWLASHQIEVEVKPIRETPPTRAELAQALRQTSGLRALFNTSGGDYKELNLKDKLADMTESDALELLASRGNLVKRPFVTWNGRHLVGFKDPSAWEEFFR